MTLVRLTLDELLALHKAHRAQLMRGQRDHLDDAVDTACRMIGTTPFGDDVRARCVIVVAVSGQFSHIELDGERYLPDACGWWPTT